MSDKRLVGEDASAYRFTLGTMVTGDGTTTFMSAGKIYKIAAKATTTSIFPVGFSVNDYYYAPLQQTLAVGDNVYPVTETLIADCNSWDMTVSADSIEVTVLKDTVKKYRKGKVDIDGTITGIDTTDQLKTAGSIHNRFIKVVNLTSGIAPVEADIFPIDSSDYFIKAYLNDDTLIGNTQVFILAQIDPLGTKWGASIGDAQEWSADFKLINIDPVMYTITNA